VDLRPPGGGRGSGPLGTVLLRMYFGVDLELIWGGFGIDLGWLWGWN
jgi:hypothetical protein